MTQDYPLLVSADDHVLEPAHLWTSRLPAKYQEIGPRVVRQRVALPEKASLDLQVTSSDEGEWADVWHYEDLRAPVMLQSAAVGFPRNEVGLRAVTFDDVRPGCYQPQQRLRDMDLAGVEAQLCFPNVAPVRFCGQGFLDAQDRKLSLLCVRAYNDFILDEWCAATSGRLIPCGIIPLWDVSLAVAEVHRCAARGMRAMCFSEAPAHLGLPSIHSGYWDPFFAACEETATVVMIHIGSSSHVDLPSKEDTPMGEFTLMITMNATGSVIDWLFSGVLVRYPRIKVCFAECQIGWLPYYLQRMDEMWEQDRAYMSEQYEKVPNLPSSYFRSNLHVTFFSDPLGLRLLSDIGVDNVLCETDYPHNDSTWPECQKYLRKQTQAAGLDEVTTEKIARGNARRLFRLDQE
jgi:predicted TIM-barrel fold metal-dependent hydrolase